MDFVFPESHLHGTLQCETNLALRHRNTDIQRKGVRL
jgi:hypothetical protein